MDFSQKPTEPQSVIPEPAVASMDNAPERTAERVPRHVVWLHRLSLVVFVVFCIELGMLLTILPWTTVWNQNSFLSAYPSLKAAAQNNFMRGLASGFGLIDIWIGIWEAVHYRDPGK
jgi:succinate dehydrogenase/fumarate reductase cytochrome b subunit